MKISVVQTSPKYLNQTANLSKIEAKINALSSDLIILPELCTSGYNFQSKNDLKKVAEICPTGPSSKLLGKLAKKKNAAIVAGFPEKRGKRIFNSALIVTPNSIRTYQKIHLFFKEKNYFTPGSKKPPVCNFKGMRFGVLICFDWFFPEISQSLAKRGADVLAHPSNLVLPYGPQGMKIRSLENLVYSATANRVGKENKLIYIGQSQILGPRGQTLGRLSKNKEGVLTCSINPKSSRNKKITSYNHIWKDRKPRLY